MARRNQQGRTMSTKPDDDFLIIETVGGPHTIVERTVTIDSIGLPETGIAKVERIRISEKVILVEPPVDDQSQ
jgi:hypothetical protein